MSYLNRLLEAAIRAEVAKPGTTLEDRGLQSAIANSLGISKQTVSYWFRQEGLPGVEHLQLIEERWRINGRWLVTGEGAMLDAPSGENLTAEERDLVKNYRLSTPRIRRAIAEMARAARKSIVTVGAVLPPLLVTLPAEEARASFNINISQTTHWMRLRRWLARVFQAGQVCAPGAMAC
jgi:transcriptional regulator with XRE-family HTH domain